MELRLMVLPGGGKRGHLLDKATGRLVALDSGGARRLPKGTVKEAVDQLRPPKPALVPF